MARKERKASRRTRRWCSTCSSSRSAPPSRTDAESSGGLPQLDRGAFRIGQPGEATVRIGLRIDVDLEAAGARLGGHPVALANAELAQPLQARIADIGRVLRERRDDRRTRSAMP